MRDLGRRTRLSRRSLLKSAGGVVGAAAASQVFPGGAPTSLARTLSGQSRPMALDFASSNPVVEKHLAATDGWVSMPEGVGTLRGTTNQVVFPDPLAPANRNLYVFGFRDVTNFSPSDVLAQKNLAQISAPLLYFDQETDIKITLTNLGLAQRPDLVDSHTIHWHGFRNAIPLFDGVPEMSIAVPIGRDFTYFYRPHDAGTYMYHCHFEDVEHVQMGMRGIVFVRPTQNKGGAGIPVARVSGGSAGSPMGYCYNDGVPPSDPRSTAYDREFALFLDEMWAEAHWADAHIQLADWSEYLPDFWLINGRAYPDTVEPNVDPTAANLGSLERLRYNPISSLITANSGDRVLLRVVSLGYQQHALTLPGIPLRVVGKDATYLRGRDGTDTNYLTDTIYIGPGEAYDAVFVAPQVTTQTTYLLYNRKLAYLNNGGKAGTGALGFGGQMTEVRISPPGTLPPQTEPNT